MSLRLSVLVGLCSCIASAQEARTLEDLTRIKDLRITVSSVNGTREQDNPFYGAQNLLDGGEHRIKGTNYTSWLSDQDASHWIRIEFPKPVDIHSLMIEFPASNMPAAARIAELDPRSTSTFSTQPVRECALDVRTGAPAKERWTKLPSEALRGFRAFYPLAKPLHQVTALKIVFPGPSMIEVSEVEIFGSAGPK